MNRIERIGAVLAVLCFALYMCGCATSRMAGASVTTATKTIGPKATTETATTISGPRYSGQNTEGVQMPAVTVRADGTVEVGKSGADLFKPPQSTVVFQAGAVLLIVLAVASAYLKLWTLAGLCAAGALALFLAVMYPMVALAVGSAATLGALAYAANRGLLGARLQEIANATLTTVEGLPDDARVEFKALMNARTSTEADTLIERLKARLSLPSESTRTGA